MAGGEGRGSKTSDPIYEFEVALWGFAGKRSRRTLPYNGGMATFRHVRVHVQGLGDARLTVSRDDGGTESLHVFLEGPNGDTAVGRFALKDLREALKSVGRR